MKKKKKKKINHSDAPPLKGNVLTILRIFKNLIALIFRLL